MDFDAKNKDINMGNKDALILDKCYGPTIMCHLRITADTKNCKWIIERQFIKQDEQGNDFTYWDLVCEVDAQESISFRDLEGETKDEG